MALSAAFIIKKILTYPGIFIKLKLSSPVIYYFSLLKASPCPKGGNRPIRKVFDLSDVIS